MQTHFCGDEQSTFPSSHIFSFCSCPGCVCSEPCGERKLRPFMESEPPSPLAPKFKKCSDTGWPLEGTSSAGVLKSLLSSVTGVHLMKTDS